MNRDSYMKNSKKLTEILNNARIDYEKNAISAMGNSNKKIWKYVNEQ